MSISSFSTPVVSFALLLLTFAPVYAFDLKGSYTLIKDSDGSIPKKDATITITFKSSKSGSVLASATQPGESVRDTGRFFVTGGNITIRFRELDWKAENRPFHFDGCNLTLPFKALGLKEGPGESFWIKNDRACSSKFTSKRQALSGSNAYSGGSGKSVSGGSGQSLSSGALSGLSGKETCAQCKYIPCVKSLIEQKKAIIKALHAIAADKGWGNLSDSPQEGRDYVNEATLSEEAAKYAGSTLDSERAQMINDMIRRIPRDKIEAVKKNCPFFGDGVIMMMTDSKVCNIDKQSVDKAIKAIPCDEIARYMYYHESYHYTKCLERLKKGVVGILTARGEAAEDVAAYSQEVAMLEDLLAKASKSTKDGCWRCGKTQVVYPSKKECADNCPNVRLKGPLMFKCWRLNEKGEHYNIISPQYRF